jgi:gamma-glutamyltranspeptidase/glutathione hydrolase
VNLRAHGTRWALATPHVHATQAGAEAFERGGNAIDAAVAAATTLAVVYPHMCGVGGDLFALVETLEAGTVAVNASGRAPSGADAAAAREAGHGSMPERGPLTVTVPGAAGGWEALHRLGGVLAWADLFGPAIEYAHDGATVSRSLEDVLRGPDGPTDPARDPLARIFAPEGTPLRSGAPFRQPALGGSLERIAAGGAAAMYGGDLGMRYAGGLRAAGVPILDDDLAGHRTDLGAALRARYRDVDVLVHPPNSQGFVLLEMLSTIQRLRIDPDPLGPGAAMLARVFRVAARDRDLHLADPDHMRIHPSTLLDDGHLAALDDEVRGAEGTPGTHVAGDTIALVTADADGRSVSLIQSLFYGFGSGILEPATGIVAQNRGACFTVEPAHPNVIAPGKRPAHTLMPVLVQRDGRPFMTTGTMGGYGQPQINALNLLGALDLGMDPLDALAAPRWLVDGMDQERDGRPFVRAEPEVPEAVRATLREAGFGVESVEEHERALGHSHMIRRGGRGLEAASDPRADGGALAG